MGKQEKQSKGSAGSGQHERILISVPEKGAGLLVSRKCWRSHGAKLHAFLILSSRRAHFRIKLIDAVKKATFATG
jgi:hypothetical protein